MIFNKGKRIYWESADPHDPVDPWFDSSLWDPSALKNAEAEDWVFHAADEHMKANPKCGRFENRN